MFFKWLSKPENNDRGFIYQKGDDWNQTPASYHERLRIDHFVINRDVMTMIRDFHTDVNNTWAEVCQKRLIARAVMHVHARERNSLTTETQYTTNNTVPDTALCGTTDTALSRGGERVLHPGRLPSDGSCGVWLWMPQCGTRQPADGREQLEILTQFSDSSSEDEGDYTDREVDANSYGEQAEDLSELRCALFDDSSDSSVGPESSESSECLPHSSDSSGKDSCWV